MKAHIREGGDEVEQNAEPDRVDREQSRIAQMRDHLLGGSGKADGADELALARQRNGHDDRAGKCYERNRPE